MILVIVVSETEDNLSLGQGFRTFQLSLSGPCKIDGF